MKNNGLKIFLTISLVLNLVLGGITITSAMKINQYRHVIQLADKTISEYGKTVREYDGLVTALKTLYKRCKAHE